jgi:hypothetical protein
VKISASRLKSIILKEARDLYREPDYIDPEGGDTGLATFSVYPDDLEDVRTQARKFRLDFESLEPDEGEDTIPVELSGYVKDLVKMAEWYHTMYDGGPSFSEEDFLDTVQLF